MTEILTIVLGTIVLFGAGYWFKGWHENYNKENPLHKCASCKHKHRAD